MKMLANVKLSPHKYKTPEGYLICQDCIIGRTGAQTYLRSEIYENDDNGNEFVDINRSEKEVFDPKTLASFENKPLTIEHPDSSVNPNNYKTLAVGNVHNVHKGDYEGEPVMYADIVVFDAEAINKIESGEMVELSCGYDCDITDGPNPEQINIRGNHVALCEQGRAGIARIQDSWGAKPIKDSVSKGSLIQEFGKQGKQYKIQKIVGNVIYAESLETERIVLFKKDEENIEWATITKSEVKDSIFPEEPYVVMSYSYSRGREFEVGGGKTLEEAIASFEEYLSSCKRMNENTSFPQEFEVELRENKPDGKVIKQAQITEEGKIIRDSKLTKDSLQDEESGLNWKIHNIVLTTNRCWDFTLNKIEKEIFEKYGYNAYSLNEIKQKVDKNELMLLPIVLSYGNVGETQIEALEIGPFNTKEEAQKFANNELKEMIQRHSDNKEEKITISFKEQIYPYHDVEFKPEEIKDSEKEEKSYYERVNDFYNELFDYFNKKYKYVDTEYHEGYDYYKVRIFDNHSKVNWEEDKTFIRNLVKKYNLSLDRFGRESGWYNGPEPIDHVYTVIIDDVEELIKDSEKKYVIALESENNESVWLDQNDKPTKEYKEAKQFDSYEEADSHRKTYCKGSVQVLLDSIDMEGLQKDLNLKQNIEKDLEGFNHGPIAESWGSITIDFNNKSDLRRAAKKLVSFYDIELFDEDPEELYIAVYEKFDEPKEIDIVEDSDKWYGVNIRKGQPAEDFKQYLRDRGLYFEPSENGNFIHFEVKNADEDVEKEVQAIIHHYLSALDSYSRRFYSNAIKALNEKLEKLEKNELLDSNQQDYEKQKAAMIDTIKKQIEEYQKKLEENE